ncbi:MAG TPA: PQQ-binding-like beta-propeller repeat protein [Thermoanaerobaculia bacterium]
MWSVPLPARGAASIVVSESGQCFVSSGHHLLAIDLEGRIAWSRESEGEVGQSVALADGRLIQSEDLGRRLVARDPSNGQEIWSVAGDLWSRQRPGIAPAGEIIHQQGSSRRPFSLDVLGRNGGEILWSRPLDWEAQHPLVIPDAVIVAAGSSLRSFDFRGRELWRADRRGFLPSEEAALAGEYIGIPPIALPGNRILTTWSWPEAIEVLVFDMTAQAVTRWPNHGPLAFPFSSPFAVLERPDEDLCLVMAQGVHLMLVGPEGELRWRQQLASPPRAILVDAAGTIIVSFSAEEEIWDLYAKPYSMEAFSGLAAFDPDGRRIFHHLAPGPVSRPMAVGRAGEIYFASEGRLWALR